MDGKFAVNLNDYATVWSGVLAVAGSINCDFDMTIAHSRKREW